MEKNVMPNIQIVADMHELVNPNEHARKLWERLEGKTLTDSQLRELYRNSEDPLLAIYRASANYYTVRYPTYVLSLGDMIVNRINFGEGTEKSVIGKMGKKARELGVPQHIYIAEHINEEKAAVEEWAYRNSFWTQMRFDTMSAVSEVGKFPIFIHLNGNADNLSSYVTREILNAEFKSPNEILESFLTDGKYSEVDYCLAKDSPKLVTFDQHVLQHGGWRLSPPDFDDDEPDDLQYKWKGGTLFGSGELYPSVEKDVTLMAMMIPQTFTWEEQMSQIEKILNNHGFKSKHNLLLIHEPLSYEPFGRKENIEGMKAYRLALKMMPENTIVVHGHTHAPFTSYEFQGHKVYQIPTNTGIKLEEVLK